jgi:DNA-directed RNA polymerase specialized sigma subunit
MTKINASSVEIFIKKHPFPKEGAKINDILVKEIQDPYKQNHKKENLKKLLKNNARLIYIIYSQFNYNQSLSSMMSFVYEGLKKATETYDPSIGMPFYHYAVKTTRGILQNHYNYKNDLIHVPVMKRKKTKIEYSDINDFSEHQHSVSMHNNEDSLSKEMTMIITEYENQPGLSQQALDDLKLLKLYRNSNLKELSIKTKINPVKLRKIIDTTSARLKRFYKNFNKKLAHG